MVTNVVAIGKRHEANSEAQQVRAVWNDLLA